jgi:hypothetical protein
LEEDDRVRVWSFSSPETDGDVLSPNLSALRDFLLSPLGLSYEGPHGVTLHLFGHRDFVLLNLGDTDAALRLTLPHQRLRVKSTSDPELEVAAEPENGAFVLGPHRWVHLAG